MVVRKDSFAPTPPMGWNSWDCYGASVTEKELMANAEYMAKYLKKYGWEYIVCDIQWYEPDANSTAYRDFVPLEMDEYSRLIPAVKRFPSAQGGKGFQPIAEKIHNMGLKFGIHIMRGIPRQAVHANTPIKGTDVRAREIAQRFSVCSWNTDMYGVDAGVRGAQEYYDSLFELYASWGVDFVKVDDICNTFYKPYDPYSAKAEIELIRHAIDKCGREIVLSLSPGPADINQVSHLQKNANMWRMTADYWDKWDDLHAMFEKCEQWSKYVKPGNWPDCDMLPLGYINIRGAEGGSVGARFTRFSKDEQMTMMSLWCIFRSPLMFGGDLTYNDEFTLSLLQNEEVLRILKHSYGAYQVAKNGTDGCSVIWKSYDEDGGIYVAMFNTHNTELDLQISFRALEIEGTYEVRDLWKKENIGVETEFIHKVVPVHGVFLAKLIKK